MIKMYKKISLQFKGKRLEFTGGTARYLNWRQKGTQIVRIVNMQIGNSAIQFENIPRHRP